MKNQIYEQLYNQEHVCLMSNNYSCLTSYHFCQMRLTISEGQIVTTHMKLLKLIGNYFEMHAGIKMRQIAFKRRHLEAFSYIHLL